MLQSGDKAMILCFVEFSDAKCALTAMEALQGKGAFFFVNVIEFDVYPLGPQENINITCHLVLTL